MQRLMRSLLIVPVAILALTAAGCQTAGFPRQSPTPATRPHPSASSPRPSAVSSPPASAAPSAPASSSSSLPAQPRNLGLGMSGDDVKALQTRLAALHYYPGPADGEFGQNTLEALWAFQAIQGMTVTGIAGPATRRALADPKAPDPLVPSGGDLRAEIDLSRQVLVLYTSGRVKLISHISSGGGYYYCSPAGGCGYAVTPTGDFRTTAFMPGWVTVPLGEMYNPVFFIGTSYAIHGSASVPLQPVSHGCVRIPMVIAEFFHHLIPTPGTPVYVRR